MHLRSLALLHICLHTVQALDCDLCSHASLRLWLYQSNQAERGLEEVSLPAAYTTAANIT